MDESAVTVVVIDDHEAVRDGIRSWCLEANPQIWVVAEGDRVALAWAGPGLQADVVVLDLQLTFGGVQQLGELRRLIEAGRQVVVYTQDVSQRTGRHCIKLGALAYVAKSEGRDHLVAAIHGAAKTLPYTTPSLSGSLLADDDPYRPQLSPMELKALRAWFTCPSKDLAAQLIGIKPRTVDSYIQRVRIKYDAAGRAAPTKSVLVQRALEDGLITMAELDTSYPPQASK